MQAHWAAQVGLLSAATTLGRETAVFARPRPPFPYRPFGAVLTRLAFYPKIPKLRPALPTHKFMAIRIRLRVMRIARFIDHGLSSRSDFQLLRKKPSLHTTMGNSSSDKLAVLIDADNAQPSIVRELLAEISRYGTANVKRAYGDWTTQNLRGWKDVLHEMAIQPMQQFSYTTGKNSTDSSLIIEAMDLLHTGKLNGFCLVSSDSDFTRLATRIREAGLIVYGFGERKTPQAFVAACDKFIYTEILRPLQSPVVEAEVPSLEPLEPMLRTAVTATAKENGWSPLSGVGSMLLKNSPSFDPRNYGHQNWGNLCGNSPTLISKRFRSVTELPISIFM